VGPPYANVDKADEMEPAKGLTDEPTGRLSRGGRKTCSIDQPRWPNATAPHRVAAFRPAAVDSDRYQAFISARGQLLNQSPEFRNLLNRPPGDRLPPVPYAATRACPPASPSAPATGATAPVPRSVHPAHVRESFRASCSYPVAREDLTKAAGPVAHAR